MSDKVVLGLNVMEIVELMDSGVGEPVKHRPDGFGITAKEYAAVKKCSEETARKMLDKGVEKGLLDKEKMVIDDIGGTPPAVYFKKEAPL